MTREEELDWLCRLKSEIYVYMPKEWAIPMNNALDMVIKDLEQTPCDDWCDVPSDEMTFEQARQAVRDLRKKLMEYLEQEPTTKTCRTCENFGSHHGICEICKDNKCWTGKEPIIKNDIPENNAENIYICSCGYGWDKSKVVRHHFCPNCGKAVASATKNDLGVDCISREQAKAAIRDKFKDLLSRVEINTILNELPPVTPQEPRKGCWEHGRELSRVFIGNALRGINYEDWHCSNCHCVIEQSIKPKWNYCPNCGAKMQEVEE